MNREQFFKKVVEHVSLTDAQRIVEAYILAKEFHRVQIRDDGERYFEHPRRVAIILMDIGPTNTEELITGTFHDLVEDRYIPARIIQVAFGQNVLDNVLVLSKVDNIDGPLGTITKRKKDLAEYFNAIRLGSRAARRVKLADRLDNLRTMGIWKKERKLKALLETQNYIMPIAHATDQRFARLIEEAMAEIQKTM